MFKVRYKNGYWPLSLISRFLKMCHSIEKFTAWRLNSTLNFARKTDIVRIAKRWVRYRFFKWNLTWNSRVRQWIFLESHSYKRETQLLDENKRFVFLSAAPASAQTMETLSKSAVKIWRIGKKIFLDWKLFLFQPSGASSASHFTIFSKKLEEPNTE